MSNNLEFQTAIPFGEEPPVENYIRELSSAGIANPWRPLPEDYGYAGFQLDDVDRGLTTVLVCEASTEDYAQHRLTAKNSAGVTEMQSVEWITAGNTGSLQTLYAQLSEMAKNAEEGVNAPDAEDIALANLTDDFIDALLRDVQGCRSTIAFRRRYDTFVADSFGISESVITLEKEWEDQTSARFFIKLERPDGTPILSCSELSKNGDNRAELRKLYSLLDEKIPLIMEDDGTKDVRKFIERTAFDTFFDSIIDRNPNLLLNDSEASKNAILIFDIFESVSHAKVIHHFLDEVALRRGPLSEPQYKRIKTMAQAVFDIMRNVRRNPRDSIFNGKTVSSIIDVANSYTVWPAMVFGPNPSMSEGCVMTRCAVLILAAILADQLP